MFGGLVLFLSFSFLQQSDLVVAEEGRKNNQTSLSFPVISMPFPLIVLHVCCLTSLCSGSVWFLHAYNISWLKNDITKKTPRDCNHSSDSTALNFCLYHSTCLHFNAQIYTSEFYCPKLDIISTFCYRLHVCTSRIYHLHPVQNYSCLRQAPHAPICGRHLQSHKTWTLLNAMLISQTTLIYKVI